MHTRMLQSNHLQNSTAGRRPRVCRRGQQTVAAVPFTFFNKSGTAGLSQQGEHCVIVLSDNQHVDQQWPRRRYSAVCETLERG
jgi:hypothetical protein